MELFDPAAPDVSFRRNAIMWHLTDRELAMGFTDSARLMAEHWEQDGPSDLLFVPLVYNSRHALELVLKDTIRATAARLRKSGRNDPKLQSEALDDWLALKAGHSLHKLAERLDKMLDELGWDSLPDDTHEVLMSLHELDPNGESFRYASVRKKDGGFEDASRPHVESEGYGKAVVDVVAMHDHFDRAFARIAQLEDYADYQDAMSGRS